MPPSFVGSTVADRYRLEAAIERGGTSTVYRATDLRLHRPVALKLVHATDERTDHRLREEARLLARLHHPNVVRVHDVGSHDGRTYVVTELIDGRSLAAVLHDGPVRAADAAAIGRDVAAALVASHAAGIVHRDLKPANILLSSRGAAYLLDYGVAAAGDRSDVTLDGEIVGTPRYLAPEQVEGARVGPPTDVFALGLVLLECLTGRPAYAGSLAETMGARLAGGPPIPDHIDPVWRQLVAEITVAGPAGRPSAADVRSRLVPLAVGSDLARLADVDGDGDGADAPTEPLPAALGDPPPRSPDATAVPTPVDATATALVPAPRQVPIRGHRRRRVVVGAALLACLGALVAAVLAGGVLDGGGTPAHAPSDQVGGDAPPGSTTASSAPTAPTTRSGPASSTTSTTTPSTSTTKAPKPGRGNGRNKGDG